MYIQCPHVCSPNGLVLANAAAHISNRGDETRERARGAHLGPQVSGLRQEVAQPAPRPCHDASVLALRSHGGGSRGGLPGHERRWFCGFPKETSTGIPHIVCIPGGEGRVVGLRLWFRVGCRSKAILSLQSYALGTSVVKRKSENQGRNLPPHIGDVTPPSPVLWMISTYMGARCARQEFGASMMVNNEQHGACVFFFVRRRD